MTSFLDSRKLSEIFLHLKKISASHKHASNAGMGGLTRTAIGITGKTEKTENRIKETKGTKKRVKMMGF